MRCASCGYRREYDIEEEKMINKHDDEFIEIKGNFIMKNAGYHQSLVEVGLYACPKCKSVILQEYL